MLVPQTLDLRRAVVILVEDVVHQRNQRVVAFFLDRAERVVIGEIESFLFLLSFSFVMSFYFSFHILFIHAPYCDVNSCQLSFRTQYTDDDSS